MYLGHLTKRVRSLFGWMSPPILKFLVLFLKRDAFPLAPVDVLPLDSTTFFPLTAFFTYDINEHVSNVWKGLKEFNATENRGSLALP